MSFPNLESLKMFLEEIAKKETATDNEDFNAYDDSGGNFDDAFDMGYRSGEVDLARDILKQYFSGV